MRRGWVACRSTGMSGGRFDACSAVGAAIVVCLLAVPVGVATEPAALDRELSAISRQLKPHKPVPEVTVKRLAELSRTATAECRGHLLRWVLDQTADTSEVWQRVSFEGASLPGARLAGPSLAERLGPVSFSEAYTSRDYQAGRKVFTAWLPGVRLRGAHLERVDLHGANLQRADLRQVSLRDANLAGAVLNGADLRGADLRGADLRGARLFGAKLDASRRGGARWPGEVLAVARQDSAAVVPVAGTPKPDARVLAFFENRIRPLLVARCVKCHGPKKAEGGLRLDSHTGLLRGGESGRVVVPGNPKDSPLLAAVRRDGELKMPPERSLSRLEIADLSRWIRQGAVWPEGMLLAEPGPALRGGPITERERKFWSFQPVDDPEVPKSGGPDVRNDIDRFVRRRLKLAGLQAVPEADRRTLLRRATFDLTGLPPTPAETRAFLEDDKPGSFRRVVDRLLESPGYGVRWGRHWLDVVRYADTAGETADFPTPLSYKYRNWVIESLNRDLPYDQFLVHQLAGDILAEMDKSLGDDDYRRLRVATGFIAISRRFGFDSEKYHDLTIQDTIDTLGQVVLGLSLGCARCHDHKYDPINAQDYYSWYGIFESTRYSFPGSEQKKKPYDLFPVVRAERVEPTRAAHRLKMQGLDKEIRTLALRLTLMKGGLRERLPLRDGEKYKVRVSPWRGFLAERLLNQKERDRDKHRGFHVWHRNNLPVVGVNVSQVLLKVPGDVPPGSLVVHPAAKDGVGIAWRSPITGRVRVAGRIVDQHRQCGDSVRWHIDRLDSAGFTPLAAAGNTRAGTSPIAAKALESVEIKQGDYLQLVLAPQASYGCDLTRVELSIQEIVEKQDRDGLPPRKWQLVPDVVDRFLLGNPHPGREDRGEVWTFFQSPVDRGAGWASGKDLTPLVLELGGGKQELARLSERLASLRRQRDALVLIEPVGMHYGAIDKEKPADGRIRLRGDKAKLGAVVARRNLEILGGEPLAEAGGSGRLELARWLTREDNPLMPRVMANRIWAGHFGRGLVATENDFGVRGERPSHPQLLDWLASRFRETGFSIKTLHRLIMDSAAYRRSSQFDLRSSQSDPESRLLWRFNRRRLSAEEIRDSMLFLSGELDQSFGGPHPFPAQGSWTFSQHAPFYGLYPTKRRSVFLMQQRLKRHPFLALFDGADPNVSTAHREMTTVPTQSLFLMNSEFVHEQSAVLADRVLSGSKTRSGRLQRAWRLTLGREATASETTEAKKFLVDFSRALQVPGGQPAIRIAWSALMRTLLTRNEFLFVD